MFMNKSLFVAAVVIFTAFLGVSAANAQTPNPQAPRCYTVASLQGSYAIVGTYGSNVAVALATRSYDGNGNLAGASIINEPTAGSATGARTLTTATQAGTYTVNCNGTGQFNRVLTSNGVQTNQVDDFVITAAAVMGGQLVATTIVDAQQTPSAIVAAASF